MASAARSRPTSRTAPPPQPTGNGKGWIAPASAAVTSVVALIATRLGALPLTLGLVIAVIGALVASIGLAVMPILDGVIDGSARSTGLGFAALCFGLVAIPSLFRIFPGSPLVDHAAISGPAQKFPITIPTDGHGRLDVITEGALATAATGAAIPVHYSFTVGDDGGSTIEVVDGTFSEEVRTQRMGRRGTTQVHNQHTAEHHTVSTAGRPTLTVTAATVEPANAPPVSLTVYPRRLPPWPLAVAIALALMAGALYVDRLPAFAINDGAFTLAIGAILGATYFFTTDNASHPEVGTLVGAAIFGGALGMAVSGLTWWITKRVAPHAA